MKFELLKISEIESYQYDGEVYDLEVEEDHSYNIDGIIVHNSDFVMLGGMFSGTDECEGEWTLNENGEKTWEISWTMGDKINEVSFKTTTEKPQEPE